MHFTFSPKRSKKKTMKTFLHAQTDRTAAMDAKWMKLWIMYESQNETISNETTRFNNLIRMMIRMLMILGISILCFVSYRIVSLVCASHRTQKKKTQIYRQCGAWQGRMAGKKTKELCERGKKESKLSERNRRRGKRKSVRTLKNQLKKRNSLLNWIVSHSI